MAQLGLLGNDALGGGSGLSSQSHSEAPAVPSSRVHVSLPLRGAGECSLDLLALRKYLSSSPSSRRYESFGRGESDLSRWCVDEDVALDRETALLDESGENVRC